MNLEAHGSAIFFGRGGTAVSAQCLVEGANRRLIFGDDVMLSWDVFIRNYASHAILDIASKTVVNKAADLLVGPHVWIGQRVQEECLLGRARLSVPAQ